MWELYLAYSEAGFRSGYLDVFQWTFAPAGGSPMNFVLVTAASIAVLIVMHGITFAVGRSIGRYNVVDVTWGLGFVGVGAVAAVLGSGDLFRRILLFVLVAVWGLRLAWHMVEKSAGKGEDPRYGALMRGDFSAGQVLRKIFLIQAAATWFVSLPLQVSAVARPDPDCAAAGFGCGRGALGIGVFFEAVGDHQLRQFKADPGQQGNDDGPRPVGMDAPSQLLRRRVRVVGAVAGVHRGLDFAADSALAGADDVLPGVRHRGAAAREAHDGPARDSANTVPVLHFSFRNRPDCEYRDDHRRGWLGYRS